MNGIQQVSFRSTQPVVEKKENKEPKKASSYAVPGAVAGTVIGAVGSYYTPFVRTSEFESVDQFVSSKKEDIEAATKDITDDAQKPHVKTLTDEQTAITTKKTAVATKLDAIFGENAADDAEKKISDVLPHAEGKPSFDAVQATVIDKAEDSLLAKEKELQAIQDAAAKVEKGKTESIKIKTLDPADKTKEIETEFKITKDAAGEATFVKGVDAPKDLKTHVDDIVKERTTFNTNKALATKLGITKDTANADVLVKKSVVKEAFEGIAQSVSETAKTAFEAIKDSLPKTKVDGKLVAMYAAGAAAVLGIIGYMMKKKED